MEETSRASIMLVYCVQVCMLLTALMETGVHGQGCPRGQYGAGCRLDCHCAHSQDCGVNGECPSNDTCRWPYFGSDCQHVDVLLTDGTSNIPRYITDGNDSTCNPDAKATSIRLTFHAYIWTLFITLRTNNNITLFYRNFTRESTLSICQQTLLYRVDDTAAEIRCDPYWPNSSITLGSRLAPYICTMHVTGGRHISLRQRVNQSSTYLGDRWDKVRAENAVDGNNSTDYAKGSCTRTQLQTTTPYWYLILDKPTYVFRIRIFNTNDNRYRLSRFLLQTFDTSGHVNWNYSDGSPQPLSVYTIRPHLYRHVKALKIQTTNLSASQYVLSLCEVQVFGYPSCPTTAYGERCQHMCPCKKGVKCNPFTGACLYTPVSYCPVGTYGDLCQSPCSENCQYGVCEAHSGGCLQCIPGYRGKFCDKVCTPGTFGIKCILKCSEKCAKPCHHITGVCSCVEGFTGDLCTECVSGRYGDKCTQTCSDSCYMNRCDALTGECETCIDKHTGYFCEECDRGWFGDNCTNACPKICPSNLCDNITGDCMSCVGNRTGPKCEDCPPGYYSALCDIRCSVYCKNRSCDDVGGACYFCIDGYRGEYCHLEIEQSHPPVWLFPLLIPVFLLFLLCFTLGGGDVHNEEE